MKSNEINRFGHRVSVSIAVLTAATFAIAYLTPPLSGPYCASGCFSYPYADIASRFPRDYYWMFPAMLISAFFVAYVAALHKKSEEGKDIYGQIALVLAAMSSSVFLVDYFVQLSVVPASLLRGETQGIALLSQFNPHGVFIALEELGYLLMSASLAFMSLTIKKGAWLRRLFLSNFCLMMLGFVAYVAIYGLGREYRFEVYAISLSWLTLIIAGMLGTRFFNKNIS